MRRSLLIALLCLTPTLALAESPSEARGIWLEANNAFQSGEYAKAATSYQRLVDLGVATSDVYFNLGTAELRAGRRGAAILALERGLRLAPGDGDAAYNLAEAQKGNVDKIVGPRDEQPFVERIGSRVPLQSTGLVFIATWVLLWAALGARFFVKKAQGLLDLFAGACAVAALISGVMLGLAAWERASSPYAVVVAPECSLREGPAKNFKAAFEVHEGLKLRVIDREQDFLRVRLPNGVEGWISEKDAPLI